MHFKNLGSYFSSETKFIFLQALTFFSNAYDSFLNPHHQCINTYFGPSAVAVDSFTFLNQNTVAGTQRIVSIRRFFKAPKHMFKSLPRHMLWIIKMELSHLLSTQNKY